MARVVMEEGRARLAGWIDRRRRRGLGLGLGCNGAIEVFIEPAEKAAEVAGALRAALDAERPISVVTVVESSSRTSNRGRDSSFAPMERPTALGTAAVDAEAVRAAEALLREERSEVRSPPTASARSSRSSTRRFGSSSAARATTRSHSSVRPRSWGGTSWWPTIARRS